MSTRCHIGFFSKNMKSPKNPEALIYKHSDGYPEGVLPTLIPFCVDFNNRRGLDDTEYAAAHCVALFINETNEGRKQYDPEGKYSYLGYGISKRMHGDIEYFYAVSPGRIKVYSVDNVDRLDTWRLLGDVVWDKKGIEYKSYIVTRNTCEICDAVKEVGCKVPTFDPEDAEPLEFPSGLQKCLEKLISVQYGDREKFKEDNGIYSMKNLTKGQAKYYIAKLKEGENA
jgi:hypothetical protein